MNFAIVTLYAVATSTLLAIVLAFLRGGLDTVSAAVALIFGVCVALVAAWRRPSVDDRGAPPTPWEWAAIVAFALVTLRIFLWVVFIEVDDIKVLSPNNLGDLSLHLTYVRYLASGVPFWPDNPIFTGGKLAYPVGVDLFHSLLTLLGLDTLRGFVWMGLAGSALTGAALWRWGRGFVLFGFLANGGFALGLFFTTLKIADFQAEFAWKSLALALLATQRGLLFALPAGLFLLASWRARLFSGETPLLPRWGEVLLYASLPLFHFHTFLFLSVLLACWFLLQPSARYGLVVLVGSAFLPATVLVWFVTDGFHGGQMLGLKPGWMWDDAGFLTWVREHLGPPERTRAALLFWPLNFGMLPFFVAALIVHLWQERDAWARAVVFPALLMFLVCCFVKFAPWEWDNTKLMVWSYLAILPFLWGNLIIRWPLWARVVSCVVLFASGFVSTLGGLDATHRGHGIATRSELDGTARGVRDIPVTERFAGAPTYNHPLLLCGRKMALGYLGHVASHGLDWQVPAGKLDSLMRGAPNWRDLASELNVRYLFWGRNEEETYPDSTQPWRTAAKRMTSGEWGTVYDLQGQPGE